VKDLSLHLMDIAQNSTHAGAHRVDIVLAAESETRMLVLTVKDDGKGMDAEFLARVTDPFTTTRTTRKVGLGIPLLKLAAELSGGSLEIDSEPGKGTFLRTGFRLDSIDRIPVGDIPGTIAALMTAWTDIEWTLCLQSAKDRYEITTAEIKEVLDGVSIGNPAIAGWLAESIEEAMTNVFGGILDEIAEGS